MERAPTPALDATAENMAKSGHEVHAIGVGRCAFGAERAPPTLLFRQYASRCLCFVAAALSTALWVQPAHGFNTVPVRQLVHPSPMPSSRTELFLRVERYSDRDGSDEDLFITLEKEKKIRSAEAETHFAGTAGNNSTAYELGIKTPSPTLYPEEIVPLIMHALKNNDKNDNGLVLAWDFTTDTTKWVFQNNITEFIESCHETADEFPTSFYGVAMYGRSWTLETELNRVGGEDGWIATQVMKTISSDGRMRRWQWELRKNRRPPCLGCWKVESIGSSDRNGDFEATDRGDGWSD